MKKVVLITGCSSGIGYETALKLGEENVVYASVRKNEDVIKLGNEAKKRKITVEVVKMDVRNYGQIKSVVRKIEDKWGKIDVLINNAGYGLIGPLESLPIGMIKDEFETNFFGVIRTIKEVIPLMIKQKKGLIINISSIAGIIGSNKMTAYCSTKFALEGLSESLYEELSQFNVSVKLIEPGFVKTEFGNNVLHGKSGKKYDKYLKNKNCVHEVKMSDVVKTIREALNDNSGRFRYSSDRTSEKRIKEKLTDSRYASYLSRFKYF